MRLFNILIGAAFVTAATISTALTANLQVRPVLIDVVAPGAASKLTLSNNGRESVNAQIRIFKWSQRKGKDILTPTRAVVASPPFVKMKPGGDYKLRIVRVSKKPVKGEESYRIIVDQIPNIKKKSGIAVKFNIRYSIPVFFSQSGVTPPDISWSLKPGSRNYTLTAKNTGGSRLRVSNLRLKPKSGRAKIISPGLAGYVLANSSKIWKQPGRIRKARGGVIVHLTGNNKNVRSKARIR